MAYDSTIEYINRDLFYEFSGVDLDIQLKNSRSNNPTRAVAIFCKNIQTWFYTEISTTYDIVADNWDDDVFKTALNWQMKHIIKYGEDGKIDDTAYNVMHEIGMINPSQQERYYRYN